MKIVLTLFLCYTFAAIQVPVQENTLDGKDALAYIHLAEDVASSSSLKVDDLRFAKELYILAALINPMYRNTAILGIHAIEEEQSLRSALMNMYSGNDLLVPSLIRHDLQTAASSSQEQQITTTFDLIRKWKTLTIEQIESIKPWAFALPRSFEPLFEHTIFRIKKPTDEEIAGTLTAELLALGGATLWSSDIHTTGKLPVTISISNDLATLYGVDPTRRVRNAGNWVEK